jgi:hypothetical protein
MNSFVDLMGNDVWSWADIDNRARAMVNSEVSPERQDELRTIMLGHVAQMRAATAKEMGEILHVRAMAEMTGAIILQSRIDSALLQSVLPLEVAQRRLARDLVLIHDHDHPEFVTPDPADAAERAAAQAIVDAATPEALALALLRNPPPPEVEAQP